MSEEAAFDWLLCFGREGSGIVEDIDYIELDFMYTYMIYFIHMHILNTNTLTICRGWNVISTPFAPMT
jgi:hypothetical protein